MKSFIASNKWILSAVIYPLSWVTYSGPNFSFLAWFAFVPLFFYLKTQTSNFYKFFGASFVVILCWTLSTSGWLFNFPIAKWQIALTIFSGTVHIAFPFVFLYFLQKKIGFSKSLGLFPFIWVIWEWAYVHFPHMMATHLLSYPQGSNIWLIQMADIGGMWMISFWVMLFNVALFFAMHKNLKEGLSKSVAISVSKVTLALILPPLLYAGYALNKESLNANNTIQASIIPTQFEPDDLMNSENQKSIIEQTLHRTDSLAFDLINAKNGSDLYVWPESGTAFWLEFPNIGSIMQQATNDWSGSLITGCRGITFSDNTDNIYTSGVMISPSYDSIVPPIQYHHKTALIPGTETIPYGDFLKPVYDLALGERRYFTLGDSYEPLIVTTNKGKVVPMGVSICYEQWFPFVWAKQVLNGAEFFSHIAAEGWYGDYGYAQLMANVTRIRAVEVRRSVVRSSNKGLSMFINSFGRTYDDIPMGSLAMATSKVQLSKEITIFSQYPNLFPASCLVFLIGYLIYLFIRRKTPSLAI